MFPLLILNFSKFNLFKFILIWQAIVSVEN